MDFQEFIQEYDGKGIDYDVAYGNQLDVPVDLLSFFSGIYSILDICKSSQINTFVFDFNLSSPFSSSFIPMNTRYTRNIILPNFSIPKISRISAYSKVAPSIIKGIMINMVNVVSRLGVQEKAVELFNLMVTKSFLYIEYISHLTYPPFTSNLLKKFKVGIIKKNIMNTMLFTHNFILFHN